MNRTLTRWTAVRIEGWNGSAANRRCGCVDNDSVAALELPEGDVSGRGRITRLVLLALSNPVKRASTWRAGFIRCSPRLELGKPPFKRAMSHRLSTLPRAADATTRGETPRRSEGLQAVCNVVLSSFLNGLFDDLTLDESTVEEPQSVCEERRTLLAIPDNRSRLHRSRLHRSRLQSAER